MAYATVKITIELELDVKGTIDRAQPSVGAERCVGDYDIQAIRDPKDGWVVNSFDNLCCVIDDHCRAQIEEALLANS